MSIQLPTELYQQSIINVVVIGAGGTGGYLMSYLAQINYLLGQLSHNERQIVVTVFDGDSVSPPNIGRQPFFPCDLGMNKALTHTHRLNTAYGTQWHYVDCNFNIEDEGHIEMLSVADFIFTAVDSGQFRHELGTYFADIDHESSSPFWIDGGCDQSDGNIIIGNLISETGAPNVYSIYGDALLTAPTNNLPSCSHDQSLQRQDFGVNHTTALHMAIALWQLLRHGQVDHHGILFDIKTGTHNPLSSDSMSLFH